MLSQRRDRDYDIIKVDKVYLPLDIDVYDGHGAMSGSVHIVSCNERSTNCHSQWCKANAVFFVSIYNFDFLVFVLGV